MSAHNNNKMKMTTNERLKLDKALYLIAAQQDKKQTTIAEESGLNKNTVKHVISGHGSHAFETYQAIAKTLGLPEDDFIAAALERAHIIETETLKHRGKFIEIVRQYWSEGAIPPATRARLKSSIDTLFNPDRKKPPNETFMLHMLHKLGFESISALAEAAGVKLPAKEEEDILPAGCPSSILRSEDFFIFKDAVRFIMDHKGWSAYTLLPTIQTLDYGHFINAKTPPENFSTKEKQTFFQNLAGKLYDTDPYDLIWYAEKLGEAKCPRYKEFPQILHAYRKSEALKIKAKLDRLAINEGLPQVDLETIEHREKIRLGKVLSGLKEDNACAQYIDALEAGEKLITPWRVSRFIRKIFSLNEKEDVTASFLAFVEQANYPLEYNQPLNWGESLILTNPHAMDDTKPSWLARTAKKKSTSAATEKESPRSSK